MQNTTTQNGTNHVIDSLKTHAAPVNIPRQNELTALHTQDLQRDIAKGHLSESPVVDAALWATHHHPKGPVRTNSAHFQVVVAPTHSTANGTMELPVAIPKKRIIVLCDGTWQDGMNSTRCHYTNVLRLSRTIDSLDTRHNPPVPQVVFYQSGIGSEKNFYSEYIEGSTGSSLADKVEEAYGFIAHNYNKGDEIFLFGFSRGAYTARMVAMFIGAIGVLSRKDLDNFATIFLNYQKRGKTSDKKEIEQLNEELKPWTDVHSEGKMRSFSDETHFSVKCVGVFDTVGSLGLPSEIALSPQIRTIFGFPDTMLGEHIERAYQALALDETRKDFDCAKFHQTPGGSKKGQVLKQCWFTGCHTDIGGGYTAHDLADLTLAWMVANVEDVLKIDEEYLKDVFRPVAKWGTMPNHDSVSGIFKLASTQHRQLPTMVNDPKTHETIHPSVLNRAKQTVWPELHDTLEKMPDLVCELMPLERKVQNMWTIDEEARQREMRKGSLTTWGKDLLKGATQTQTGLANERGEPIMEKSMLGRVLEGVGLVVSDA